jgi:hypothetical protein
MEDTILRPLVLRAVDPNPHMHRSSKFCDFVVNAGSGLDVPEYYMNNFLFNIYSFMVVMVFCQYIYTEKKAQVHPWKIYAANLFLMLAL